MVVDGTSFVKRSHIFMQELRRKRYPNSTSLAELARCSRNTAQRTIYRLRDEHLVPIVYDESLKGYYLENPDFELPALIPPGKDELTALLLLRDLASMLDSKDLHQSLDSLWSQFASRNPQVSRELEPLTNVFSSDLTSVGDLADLGIIEFVRAAHAGESIEILYRSPWRHQEDRTYRGRILKVHHSDGNLYLMFLEESGREIILNSSFIKDFRILNQTLTYAKGIGADTRKASFWLEGFGIWSGEEPEEITIKILPPASQYYAAQRWRADQEDSWDHEILIRKINCIISPEIVRRILSLGIYIDNVDPPRLKKLLMEDVENMHKKLFNGKN